MMKDYATQYRPMPISKTYKSRLRNLAFAVFVLEAVYFGLSMVRSEPVEELAMKTSYSHSYTREDAAREIAEGSFDENLMKEWALIRMGQ
ncbi:MAG: hypothetical protein U9R08_04060 [Nanoarchaeota archaeon]|nr:hypothetical protein [Nanoarchaeota archaeon]